jgi:hypothetical protein
LVLAIVGFDVSVAQEVVEPMSPELTDNSTNHWSEVEEGSLGIVEEVWWRSDELSYSGNNSDGPGEEEHDIQS